MTHETKTPYQEMLAQMRDRYPNYADLWVTTREEFGAVWEREFDVVMNAVFDSESRIESAIDGYAEFCTDAVRSQIFFEKFRRYRSSSYAEASERYYHNADFMFRSYLPGMIISHWVWPHHHRMLHYFRSLIAEMRDNISSFAEVGTGCGMYSKELLSLVPEAKGYGYDISKHALDFTLSVVRAFGFEERYEIRQRDILEEPLPEPVDLVLNQEVLEHLEDPQTFINGLFAMTKPGGHAYIAAAVNAGHVDHIYLYRSPDEIAQQLVAAGYEILESRSEYAYGGKAVEITPCHAGFLCRRRR